MTVAYCAMYLVRNFLSHIIHELYTLDVTFHVDPLSGSGCQCI